MIICKCDACDVEFRKAIMIDCNPSLYDDSNRGRTKLFSDVPFVELYDDAGRLRVRVVHKDICSDCIQKIKGIK